MSEDDVHLMLELLNQLWERGSPKFHNSIIAGGWLITIAGVFDAEKMQWLSGLDELPGAGTWAAARRLLSSVAARLWVRARERERERRNGRYTE